MTAKRQANFRFDNEAAATLIRLAGARYQGNKTLALRAGVMLLDVVLACPATATIDPNNAGALLDAARRAAAPPDGGGDA